MKIGIIREANYGKETDQFIENNKDNFYQSDTSSFNLKLLLGGRVDAIFSNEDVMSAHKKDLALDKDFVRSDKALFSNGYKIGFSLKSKADINLEKVNEQIQRVKSINNRP